MPSIMQPCHFFSLNIFPERDSAGLVLHSEVA